VVPEKSVDKKSTMLNNKLVDRHNDVPVLTTKSSRHCGLGDFFFWQNASSSSALHKECPMVLIKVQYDAYNRQFKLLNSELAHTLIDGESYLLLADLSTEDLILRECEEAAVGTTHVVAQTH
jgi:hypothetical protein